VQDGNSLDGAGKLLYLKYSRPNVHRRFSVHVLTTVPKENVHLCLAAKRKRMMSSCKGKVEMEAIAYGYHEVDYIHQWIVQLIKAIADLNSLLMSGQQHIKHRLISETGKAKMPQIHLRLSVKMPRKFDTSLADSPREQFEICYKLLQLTNMEEGNQLGTVTCDSFCIQVNNLLAQRCYEFTVKRTDACCLVNGFWKDTMVLRNYHQGASLGGKSRGGYFPC
uniref:DUF5581 domain-containing protein n=1 Tax=Salmo trutta TaxID=8032 RepID=A0A673W7G0_SALTR